MEFTTRYVQLIVSKKGDELNEHKTVIEGCSAINCRAYGLANCLTRVSSTGVLPEVIYEVVPGDIGCITCDVLVRPSRIQKDNFGLIILDPCADEELFPRSDLEVMTDATPWLGKLTQKIVEQNFQI